MSGERWSWERGTVTRDLVMTEAEIRARQPQGQESQGLPGARRRQHSLPTDFLQGRKDSPQQTAEGAWPY